MWVIPQLEHIVDITKQWNKEREDKGQAVPAANQIFKQAFFKMAGMRYKEQAIIRGPGPNGKPLPNSVPTEQLCSEQAVLLCQFLKKKKVGRRKKDPPKTWPCF